MQLTITPNYIDIIIVLLLVIMFVRGCRRGFVVYAYDIASAILIFVIATRNYKNLAAKITLINSTNTLITPYLNQALVFLLLLAVLYLLRFLAGSVIKPLLRGLFRHLKITGTLNAFLGGILNDLKWLFIIYMALAFFIVPFYSNGQEVISHTRVASMILRIDEEDPKQASFFTDEKKELILSTGENK